MLNISDYVILVYSVAMFVFMALPFSIYKLITNCFGKRKQIRYYLTYFFSLHANNYEENSRLHLITHEIENAKHIAQIYNPE